MKKPRPILTIAEFVLKLFQTSWNAMSTCQVTPKLNPLSANIVTKHLHPLLELKGTLNRNMRTLWQKIVAMLKQLMK